MTTLAEQPQRIKGLLVGNPKTGKTGSLASLANSGRYELFIIDLEDNLAPLAQYVKPEFQNRVHFITLNDKMRLGPSHMQANGVPITFQTANQLLTAWKGTNADGTEYDFGSPADWGLDRVLVIDSLSRLSDAAFRWTLFKEGRIEKGPRDRDYGLVANDMFAFMDRFCSEPRCHVLLIAHMRLIGPPTDDDRDSEIKKEVKEKLQSFIAHRWYPYAHGQQVPQRIGAYFPYLILFKTRTTNGKTRRSIIVEPQPDVDVGVPLVGIDGELPVESGLLTLFDKATRFSSQETKAK